MNELSDRDQEALRRQPLCRTLRRRLRLVEHCLDILLEVRDHGRESDREHLTLNQCLDRWLELAARPKLRAKSYGDCQALLGRHIRPALGERELSGLAPLDLQSVYHQMRASGFSPRTVHYTHAVLHAALEQAVRWRQIKSNAAAGVEIPKPTRRGMPVLEPDQRRRAHGTSDALKPGSWCWHASAPNSAPATGRWSPRYSNSV
jgi:hypothetical protein